VRQLLLAYAGKLPIAAHVRAQNLHHIHGSIWRQTLVIVCPPIVSFYLLYLLHRAIKSAIEAA
jgi:hypothetical protein